MAKQLIMDYMQFKPIGSLNESNGSKYGVPGGFIVQGVLQRAGAKNQDRYGNVKLCFCSARVWIPEILKTII